MGSRRDSAGNDYRLSEAFEDGEALFGVVFAAWFGRHRRKTT